MENKHLIRGKREQLLAYFTNSMNIALLIVCSCLFFFGCNKKEDKIPLADKNALKEFFEVLFRDTSAAYTLFGSKPISIADYNSWDPTSFETLVLEKGWECWCKYNHFFPSKNFVLRRLDFGKCRYGFNSKEILIINKQATLNTLKKHLKLVQEHLHNDYTADEVLAKLLESNEFLKNLIKTELFGILLGYGQVNALHFEKRRNLSIYINAKTYPPLHENIEGLTTLSLLLVTKAELEPNSAVPTTELSLLKQELNNTIEIANFFELDKSDHLLEKIQSPVFWGILDHEETRQLYQEYSATRTIIEEAYKDKPIFEVTMNQWMKT